MKKSNFNLNVGRWHFQGFWAIVLGIIIALPILALVAVIVGAALSLAGVAITFALGAAGIAIVFALVVAGIAIILALLSLLLPKKWRDRLGIKVNFTHHKPTPSSRPKTTPDGKPIVDVDFKEEK